MLIDGLKVDNCKVKDSVLKMLKECGVKEISFQLTMLSVPKL